MATEQEIAHVHKLMHENHPKVVFDKMKSDSEGAFAVLRFLNRSGGNVRSKDISQVLHVSTARMTVILRKLYDKKLITKVQNVKDGRSSLIALTDEGRSTINKLHQQMDQTIGKIIDEVGMAEVEKVFYVLGRMRELNQEKEQEILNVCTASDKA